MDPPKSKAATHFDDVITIEGDGDKEDDDDIFIVYERTVKKVKDDTNDCEIIPIADTGKVDKKKVTELKKTDEVNLIREEHKVTHLRVSGDKLATLKFPDYNQCKRRRIMPKSTKTAENINIDCAETNEAFALKHCVLWHLHKQSTDCAHAAEQLLCSLQLPIPYYDINKKKNGMHTEEQLHGSHKEGNSEKQHLIAYLNFVLKSYSHPGESQQKLNLYNQCIFRVTCFRKALQWLSKNTQSDLKPNFLMNLKNTINGLEITAKHLESLQKQDGDHLCSVNESAQVSLHFEPSLLETQNSDLISPAKKCTEMSRISVESTGNEKSSVFAAGSHSFLVRLYTAWNSQCRISSDSGNVLVCNDSTKFSVDVTDHCSVEPKTPESFCFYGASTEDYDFMISNNDASSSDEADRLIISPLSDNSESLISSKECANPSDMLSINDHNIAATSDENNKTLLDKTNHPLLPETSSAKTDTTKHSVLNMLGSSVNCSLANVTSSPKEEVKYADLMLTCSNSETDDEQMSCDSISASTSTPHTTTEETVLPGKRSLSLSQPPCTAQSSKINQNKNGKLLPESSSAKTVITKHSVLNILRSSVNCSLTNMTSSQKEEMKHADQMLPCSNLKTDDEQMAYDSVTASVGTPQTTIEETKSSGKNSPSSWPQCKTQSSKINQNKNGKLLPESSSAKTNTTKHSVLNILRSSVNYSLTNVTSSQKEEVKHADLMLPCSNSETNDGQMACNSISASASTPHTTTEETRLSGKRSSLSQPPCTAQGSKINQNKNGKLLPESSSAKTDTTKHSVLNILRSSVNCSLANVTSSQKEEVKHADQMLPCSNSETNDGQMAYDSINASTSTPHTITEETTLSGKSLSLSQPPCTAQSSEINQNKNGKLLPESSSAKTDTTKHSVLNILRSSVNCSLANVTSSQKEEVKHADQMLPCSNSETVDEQMSCDSISASASTPQTTIEETTLSCKNSLSRPRRKTQSSKRNQNKNESWKIRECSHEVNEESNLPPDECQSGSQNEEARKPIRMRLQKVRNSVSTEDTNYSGTEQSSRNRKRKSSNMKDSQNSEMINSATENTVPSVQQAPLISHLWKKHVIPLKNTSHDCVEAQSSSGTTDQNESSLINSQAESHIPDTGKNNICQEKTVHLNHLQLPLDLSPKQSNVVDSALVNSTKRSKITPEEINGNHNEKQIENVLHCDLKTQSFDSSITSSPPKNNLLLSYLTRTSPVKRTEVSDNQSEHSAISGQDDLLDCKHLSESTQPFDHCNTNIPLEAGTSWFTSAKNQLPAQKINSQSEGRVFQINKELNATASINQCSLQKINTTVSTYREPSNRNGSDGQSNHLKLANENTCMQFYNAQQFPNLQDGVDVPRLDKTSYDHGAFNGVHTMSNNMNDASQSGNVPSQNGNQGISHLIPYVQPPIVGDTADGIKVPNNGLAKQGPSAFNGSKAHDMIYSSKAKQIPGNLGNISSNSTLVPENLDSTFYARQRPDACPSRAPHMIAPFGHSSCNLGTMLDAALSNGTHMLKNVPVSYGRPDRCTSRVPVIMGPQNTDKPTQNLENIFNTSISNGTLIPGNLNHTLYESQRPDACPSRAPDMIVSSGHSSYSLGTMLNAAFLNGTNMLKNAPISYATRVPVIMGPPNADRPTQNLGNMFNTSIPNGMPMAGSLEPLALPSCGEQRPEACASRAPNMMSIAKTQDTACSLGNMANNGTLMPNSTAYPLYGRQQTPHSMGAPYAMATPNGTHIPENHLFPSCGRYTHGMFAPSVRQAPGKMYGRNNSNLAVDGFNNNETLIPNNIMATSYGNRQIQPAAMTAPRGRGRGRGRGRRGRATYSTNLGQKLDEFKEVERATISNSGCLPSNIMNAIAGSNSVGYRNVCPPVQQFNDTSAENMPRNYLDGNQGQALQTSPPTFMSNFSHWFSQSHPTRNNQVEQENQLQPSPTDGLHNNNQRNQTLWDQLQPSPTDGLHNNNQRNQTS